MRWTSSRVATTCFALWALFVTVEAISVNRSWDRVGQSLFGRTSDEWWMVGLTAVLTAAAILAGTIAFRQLEEARQSRMDAQRPFLILARAVRTSDVVTMRFQNIGAGPGIGVSVVVWFLGVNVVPDTVERLAAATSVLEEAVGANMPATATFQIGALGANGEREMPLSQVPQHPEATSEMVAALISYEDIFGRTFPRRGEIALQISAVEDHTVTVDFA